MAGSRPTLIWIKRSEAVRREREEECRSAGRYHPRMHRHDQQRLAKLVSEFIDGCGSEPPIYLIAVPSLSNPVTMITIVHPSTPVDLGS